jgi:L-alanine-DL-glutamate epimerase-like enolase superfamily enzyme
MVEETTVIENGFIYLNERPGHGLTLNEEVARAHAKPGHAIFGDTA